MSGITTKEGALQRLEKIAMDDIDQRLEVPLLYASFDETVKADREIIMKALKHCAPGVIFELYSKFPLELQQDPEVVESAIHKCHPGYIHQLYEKFAFEVQQDREVVEQALRSCHPGFIHNLYAKFPLEFQQDPEVIAKAREKCSPGRSKDLEQLIQKANAGALEEPKKKAKEEARLKAEQESKRKAEEEARLKAEQESKRKAEEEARNASKGSRLIEEKNVKNPALVFITCSSVRGLPELPTTETQGMWANTFNENMKYEKAVEIINLSKDDLFEVFETELTDSRCGRNDALIVFVNSHGTSSGFWTCNPKSRARPELVEFIELQNRAEYLSKFRRKPKIFVYDCCLQDEVDPSELVAQGAKAASQTKDTVSIFACARGDTSFAIPGEGALFSKTFMETFLDVLDRNREVPWIDFVQLLLIAMNDLRGSHPHTEGIFPYRLVLQPEASSIEQGISMKCAHPDCRRARYKKTDGTYCKGCSKHRSKFEPAARVRA